VRSFTVDPIASGPVVAALSRAPPSAGRAGAAFTVSEGKLAAAAAKGIAQAASAASARPASVAGRALI
jgi:hypothetical protein